MKLTATRIAGILRDNGYKLTPQRHALLKVIAAQRDHLSPDKLYEKAQTEYPGIGRVTVYRTLELLDRLNLVCHVHSAVGCHDYMMRGPVEHHHHLICSGCGRAIDFINCDLKDLERQLSVETGFEIRGHLLELYGVCSRCQCAE
jgi:Fur family ferric uptake transcriptional regulator